MHVHASVIKKVLGCLLAFLLVVKVLLGAGVVMVDAVELVVVVVVDFLNLHRNVNSRRQVW